jgi:S-adenosylmethionine uptake transporter
VDKARWIATIIGFIGIIVIMQPGTDTFRMAALVPMTAALLFAILDIFAKKMIKDEHPLTLLFYFGLVTTLVSFPVMVNYFEMPTASELFFLCLLGIGGNMIQVCLFRAFSSTEASALAPFRYAELPVAIVFGFAFFGQLPTLYILGGAALIIASTFYITTIETKKEAVE